MFQEPHPEWDVADVHLEPDGVCGSVLHPPGWRLELGETCHVPTVDHWQSVLSTRRYVTGLASCLLCHSFLDGK